MKICPNCGASVDEVFLECPVCGGLIGEASAFGENGDRAVPKESAPDGAGASQNQEAGAAGGAPGPDGRSTQSQRSGDPPQAAPPPYGQDPSNGIPPFYMSGHPFGGRPPYGSWPGDGGWSSQQTSSGPWPHAPFGGFAPDPALDIRQNSAIAVLSYFGILFLVPLIAKPHSPFARFHAGQGFNLFLPTLIIGGFGQVFRLLAPHVPDLMRTLTNQEGILWLCAAGVVVLSILSSALSLALFALSIVGVKNVVDGKCKELPVVGRWRIIK